MNSKNSANITEVLKNLDDSILASLIKDHVWCGKQTSTSRSLSLGVAEKDAIVAIRGRASNQGEWRSLLIDGVSLGGVDTANSNNCAELSPSSTESSCDVFDGTYTLYVRETSLMSNSEADLKVLNTIKDGMNGTSGTLKDSDSNIESLYYHGETFSDGTTLQSPDVFSGINQPEASAPMSALGIGLLAFSSVITLLFIFAATRRQERHRVTRMEEILEEDGLLFGKGIGLDALENETDLMSNVHIVGDEDNDSEYSIGRNDLKLHGLNKRSDAVNVHKCTSATCQICSPKLIDPTFVRSIYPESAQLTNAKSRNYSAPDTIEM